jgi:hypothetical protein
MANHIISLVYGSNLNNRYEMSRNVYNYAIKECGSSLTKDIIRYLLKDERIQLIPMGDKRMFSL